MPGIIYVTKQITGQTGLKMKKLLSSLVLQ